MELILLRRIFCVGLSILFGAAIMSFGIYEEKISLVGPFNEETSNEKTFALYLNLEDYMPLKYLFSSCGDSNSHPTRSRLGLTLNDAPLELAHSIHSEIRAKGEGRFSHWGESVIFSMPAGLENTGEVFLEVRLPIYVNPAIVYVGLFLCTLSGILISRRLRKVNLEKYNMSTLNMAKRAGVFLTFLCSSIVACSILFLISCIAALISGYFLPNTAFFRWFPRLNWLATEEPFFGHVMLLIALFGYIVSWLAAPAEKSRIFFIGVEKRLELGFRRFGLLFLIALFCYSVGATWSGIPRSQDLSGSALAGLVPFSDAHDHFHHSYMQALGGEWHSFIGRRPLAASFRTVLLAVVNFNSFYFLILQVFLLAAATFLAANELVKWRGIWSGLTFMGLILILVRPYLCTHLTEPLGIFWALLSVPFFIRSLQTQSITDKIISFQLTLWALLTRMGSMFTLPFIGIWIVLSEFRSREKITKCVCILLGVTLINILLLKGMSYLYQSKEGAIGSNFFYVICGLTHGTDWSGPSRIYSELSAISSEKEKAAFLYEKALKKFQEEPSIFFTRLAEGEHVFLSSVWTRMLTGYSGGIPYFFPSNVWWIASLLGLFRLILRLGFRTEFFLWILIICSITLSAPFVIFDDGWRVLSASFPLLAVLFSCAFESPVFRLGSNLLPPDQSISLRWTGSLFVMSILFLAGPFVVNKIDILGGRSLPKVNLEENQEIALGTSRMSGMLVVPDGGALPINVPSIFHSDYVRIVKNSGIENYECLVSPFPQDPPPFGIVATVSPHPKSSGLMIVPAHVLSSIDDTPWTFKLNRKTYWNRVTEAERIQK